MALPIVLDGQQPAAGEAAVERKPATALSCLHCQLLGRRRLLCREADLCAALPHRFALGPVLLVAWLATMVAFFVAIAG